MLTAIVPAEAFELVTVKVYRLASTFTKDPAVPPVTAISSATKLLPTSSLKVNVNTAVPDAPAAAVMATVGGTLSVDSVPPPQALINTEAAKAQADSLKEEEKNIMASAPG